MFWQDSGSPKANQPKANDLFLLGPARTLIVGPYANSSVVPYYKLDGVGPVDNRPSTD